MATLRRIVREELAACQPFRVVIVGGEVPTNEEPKEEPAEEVKEEAPVEELQPSVDFWEVAREVWPQLDHPNPLPKEQPKPEPVVEEPVEEEEEELPEFEEEPEEIYDENGNPINGSGNVYGGGDQSTVNNTTTATDASTTINITGNTEIFGNVFGGGNMGLVSGNATVNIITNDEVQP